LQHFNFGGNLISRIFTYLEIREIKLPAIFIRFTVYGCGDRTASNFSCPRINWIRTHLL